MPTHSAGVLAEGLAHHRAGRFREAERAYRRVIAKEPRNADALHLLGLVAHQAGDLAAALASLGKAVALKPSSRLYLNNFGAVQRAAGDAAAAEATFGRVLALDPRDATALLNLGNLAADRGDLEGAVSRFEAAIAADPANPRPANNLGVIRHRQERLAEAEAAFRAALARDPRYAEAASNLGSVLLDAGRPQEAEAACRQALAADPGSADARNGFGLALLAREQPEVAAEAFQAVIAAQPARADAQRNLGLALAAAGDYDRAALAYRAAEALDPRLEGLAAAMAEADAALVPRWHFPMMNDAPRNAAFAAAIAAVVRPGDLVLEIGTGAGLLAMLAARAGGQVVTCERSAAVAAAATEIVARNGLAGRVTVLAKASTTLAVGRELTRPADVLIAEIFDVGLLGEGALASLAHARASLLAPDARVIPSGARVLAALVQSEALRQEARVGTVCGFDLSPFNAFARRSYETASLGGIAHRLLSAPVAVFDFDFTPEAGALPTSREVEVPVTATAAGRADALVFWYELALSGGQVLSTGPEAAGTHWRQAASLLDPPRPVEAGETLTVRARHDRSSLVLTLACA